MTRGSAGVSGRVAQIYSPFRPENARKVIPTPTVRLWIAAQDPSWQEGDSAHCGSADDGAGADIERGYGDRPRSVGIPGGPLPPPCCSDQWLAGGHLKRS